MFREFIKESRQDLFDIKCNFGIHNFDTYNLNIYSAFYDDKRLYLIYSDNNVYQDKNKCTDFLEFIERIKFVKPIITYNILDKSGNILKTKVFDDIYFKEYYNLNIYDLYDKKYVLIFERY